MKKIKALFNKAVKKVTCWLCELRDALRRLAVAFKAPVQGCRGEGYVDSAIKIIIAVVIGGLLLAGLYTLFNTTIIPQITEKITDMFSYSGS